MTVYFANIFFSESPYLDCGGNNGWKIWHRLSVWPHFPLYSRAVPNHDKVRVTFFFPVIFHFHVILLYLAFEYKRFVFIEVTGA